MRLEEDWPKVGIESKGHNMMVDTYFSPSLHCCKQKSCGMCCHDNTIRLRHTLTIEKQWQEVANVGLIHILTFNMMTKGYIGYMLRMDYKSNPCNTMNETHCFKIVFWGFNARTYMIGHMNNYYSYRLKCEQRNSCKFVCFTAHSKSCRLDITTLISV